MTKLENSRIYCLDYIKALIIVLIVAHHSSMAYSVICCISHKNFYYSTAQILDSKKLYIFDYFEDFNDIYLMPLMFLISGFFVFDSIKKYGAIKYVQKRFKRLMLPFIFSIFILMPVSYYPANLLQNKDLTLLNYISTHYIFNFYHIPGPIWFLGALFVFDAIFSMLYKFFPGKIANIINSIENTGTINLSLSFASLSIIIYFISYISIPSDDLSSMATVGPIWFQKNRSLLYFCFFILGVITGATTKYRNIITNNKALSDVWLFKLVLCIMLFGVFRYLQFSMIKSPNGYLDEFVYCALFVFIAITATFAWFAIVGRFFNNKSRIMQSLTKHAYGIFIFHFLVVIWMQYLFYYIDLSAGQKFYIVFSSSLFLSWLITYILKKIPYIKSIL